MWMFYVNAQRSFPDTLTTYRINTPINFDGNPNDSAWKAVTHISNFTQRELNFGNKNWCSQNQNNQTIENKPSI